jgi:hypothetical protein
LPDSLQRFHHAANPHVGAFWDFLRSLESSGRAVFIFRVLKFKLAHLLVGLFVHNKEWLVLTAPPWSRPGKFLQSQQPATSTVRF